MLILNFFIFSICDFSLAYFKRKEEKKKKNSFTHLSYYYSGTIFIIVDQQSLAYHVVAS